MKVTFLGTGTSQGVPVIGCGCEVCKSKDPRDSRLRTSVLIEEQGKTLVIDTGPDFRQQMLSANVQKLDAVLFTHAHRDHIAGLDDTRSLIFKQQKPMSIYAEQHVLDELKNIFAYAFAQFKYPGVPEFNVNLIDTSPFMVEGINVIPIRGMHYRLPVLGFRINDFTYITDINYISQEEKQKIIGTKDLVICALRKTKHISHFNLEQALDVIDDLYPRRAYLVHMCHEMGLHEEVSKELPSNVMFAYDGLSIEL